MKKTLTASLFALSLMAVSCGSKNTPTEPSPTANTPAAAPAPAVSLGKKGTLLTQLVGEHSLKAIEGFTGANTLMDYTLIDGKWEASSSSLSDGEREAYPIELSDKDLQKLKSMKIVVAPDLSVSLSCDNKTYFKTVFNENAMEYSLKKSPKDYGSSVPESLQKSSIFIDNSLYLYANDALPGISELDIAGVQADVALLTYNEANKEFNLSLFYGDCCDASNYMFK